MTSRSTIRTFELDRNPFERTETDMFHSSRNPALEAFARHLRVLAAVQGIRPLCEPAVEYADTDTDRSVPTSNRPSGSAACTAPNPADRVVA